MAVPSEVEKSTLTAPSLPPPRVTVKRATAPVSLMLKLGALNWN